MRQPDLFLFVAMAIIIVVALLTVITGMYMVIAGKNRTIRRLRNGGAGAEKSASDRTEDRFSFYDTGGTMKLTVSSSNLYYIESDDNYVKVWYTDGKGVLRSQMVRGRLKAVEETFRNSSLVRCSRKCIVNADRVKVISKEPTGYFLDMGNEDIPPIDVSKAYQTNVFSKLGVG